MLEEALKEAGYRVQRSGETIYFGHRHKMGRGMFAGSKMEVPQGWDANIIKQEYSLLSVKASAKKMGWTVKQDAKNKFKMKVVKRV